jgi:hypothetical protein
MNKCIKCGGKTGRREEWAKEWEGWVCVFCGMVSGTNANEYVDRSWHRYYNDYKHTGQFYMVPSDCLFVMPEG